jgi:hypothetical protein
MKTAMKLRGRRRQYIIGAEPRKLNPVDAPPVPADLMPTEPIEGVTAFLILEESDLFETAEVWKNSARGA